MRTVRLGDTGVETSVIGFGCADLFREPSRVRRRRLLETAFDAGIRHFDVAPMYGLGRGERELGRFARERRGEVVIATKFGISPTHAAKTLGYAQGPVQRLLNAAPLLRQGVRPYESDVRAGVVGSLLYRDSGYEASAARASLERSLRTLRTDYVDLLFLHDPAPGSVESDDVCAYMESARTAGRLRAWGVAGELGPTLDAARVLGSSVPVLQLRREIFAGAGTVPLLKGQQARILFGVIGRALRRITVHIESDEVIARRWSEAIGVRAQRPGVIASLLLRDALQASDGGPVLFSTVRDDRIHAAVATVTRDAGDDSQLEAFRTLVADELAAGEGRP